MNLHPGLLPEGSKDSVLLSDGTKIPAIRGMHTKTAVQFAIEQGFSATGSTVHFITEKVDEGPVVARSEVKILPGDSVESLYKRMKKEEHKILPYAVNLFCNDKLVINNNKVSISNSHFDQAKRVEKS